MEEEVITGPASKNGLAGGGRRRQKERK